MHVTGAYDYVVVGGGTAGCVLAARLSEDPHRSVCLIEAGGPATSPLITVPMLYFLANALPRLNWGYRTEPESALGERRLNLTQAKVLGGGSSINGLIYTRGYSEEYDRWGIPGWSFRELKPYFDAVANTDGEDVAPIHLTQAMGDLEICDAFLQAAEEEGYPLVDDLNGDVAHGFGYVHYTIAKGRRCGSDTAYLAAARSRPNLQVLSGTTADRIIIEKGRATGALCRGNKGPFTVRATSEIILTAGAINSPKLLMLSGIGPAAHLQSHAIEVRADHPFVGQNLANHLRYSLRYETVRPITAARYYNPLTAAAGLLQYILQRRGFLAGTILPVSGVIRYNGDVLPRFKASLSTALLGNGPGLRGMMPRAHGFAIPVYACSPFSRGEVQLRSADADAAPLIIGNYLTDPRDRPILADAIERMCALAAQRPLARLISRRLDPPEDSNIEAEISRTASNVYHAVGTCRIGTDGMSVVDPNLRVRGVEGLRVADSSVIPSLVGSGTYALALLVAERAAALISITGQYSPAQGR